MPRNKKVKSMKITRKPKTAKNCISCNCPINQNAYQLYKQCNKCYNDNTNKSVVRKASKAKTVKRSKGHRYKMDRNFASW